ncbi:hypothetical protein BKA67DRAFT_512048 [Truncatella angustata]|uniref:Uncharacterized protein n=1 Tax=Truncatella angustata TaxID=152316 RepID=A0A9P9A0N8_9PEZI|nr:uncharacterized protein BKA67DRAFT_512048 [Truncatella angustata]KAH6658607.1 hypothetical protein BKA67DRAFT_512048 [Truncatella angustata]
MDSSYNSMIIESSKVKTSYGFLAAISTWFLLAGFFILPATFAFLQNAQLLEKGITPVDRLVDLNKGIIPVAIICFIIGSAGTTWLWYKFRGNYIWLVTHLFLPGFLNSVSCLFTILVNIYTAQGGNWSLSAQITMGIVSFSMCTMAVSFFIYQFCCLSRVRKSPPYVMNQRSRG